MIQPTKYRIEASFLDGKDIEIVKKEITSNQVYVNNVVNNKIVIDTPLSQCLTNANNKAEDTFIWGLSKWGDSTKFIKNKNEIVGGMSSSYGKSTRESGRNDYLLIDKATNNANPIFLDITAEQPIDNFTIYFDKGWGVFGSQIEVNNKIYTSDDFIFTYKQEIKQQYFSIKITHSNKANYPIIILGVFSGFGLIFDKSTGLKTFERNNRNSYDLSTADGWGIVSQHGKAEIKDIDTEIRDLEEMGILQNQQPLKVQMTNATSGEWLTIGDYYAKFSYSYGADNVPIEMSSKVEKWQDILYGGRALTENVSAYTLLQELRILTNVAWNISAAATTFLQSINIKYCYLDSSTLYEAINKVLYIGMCVLWENEQGEILIGLYKGTRYNPQTSTVYRVNSGSIYGNSQGKLNNVVSGVEVEETKIYNAFNDISLGTNTLFSFTFGADNNISDNPTIITNSEVTILTTSYSSYNIINNTYKMLCANVYGYFDTTINKKVNSGGIYSANELYRIVTPSGVIGTNRLNLAGEKYYTQVYSDFYFEETQDESFTDLENVLFDQNATWGAFFLLNKTTLGKIYFKAKLGYKAKKISDNSNGGMCTNRKINVYFDYQNNKKNQKYGTAKNKTTLATNELMQVDTISGDKAISQVIADSIIASENGRQQLELLVMKNDFYAYDRSGNKLATKIDSEQGQVFQVGQFIEIWNEKINTSKFKNNKGETRIYEIREVQLEKAGSPLMCRLKVLSQN